MTYEKVEKDLWPETYRTEEGLIYIEDRLDHGQASLDDPYADRYKVELRNPLRPEPETLHEDIETLEEARELLQGELG